jgi:hypothetical protein
MGDFCSFWSLEKAWSVWRSFQLFQLVGIAEAAAKQGLSVCGSEKFKICSSCVAVYLFYTNTSHRPTFVYRKLLKRVFQGLSRDVFWNTSNKALSPIFFRKKLK